MARVTASGASPERCARTAAGIERCSISTRAASCGSSVTGSQRPVHSSPRRTRPARSRPRATSSSASLAASATNRSESPTTTAATGTGGRASARSSAAPAETARTGTSQSSTRSNGASEWSSCTDRRSCGEAWGPAVEDGSANVSREPGMAGDSTDAPRRSSAGSNSVPPHANGCKRGFGDACGRPGRPRARAGSEEPSPHRHNPESRDQMAWTTITAPSLRADRMDRGSVACSLHGSSAR